MPKLIDFTLTDEQIAELNEAMKQDKRPEVRQRATAIRLLSRGDRLQSVAEVMSVTGATMYNWWHRYQEEGIDGLANQPKGRPKPKADAAYLEALEKAIERDPGELGYDFAIWTVEQLRDHLAHETGVVLSVGRLRVLIRQQGYVYRRPKHDLTSLQDADAKAAAQIELETLKRGRDPAISGFSLWTKPR
jgi:transposase